MAKYSEIKYATELPTYVRAADPSQPLDTVASMQHYTNLADLPATSDTVGDKAFITSTNKLYIWSGVGWYLVAEVTNASPSSITGVNSTYSLATDGTATTITAVATDPEGLPLSWSSTVSAGSLNGTTVSNVDNVFTVTPHATNATTFTLTFSVTDGVNSAVSYPSAFTLSFIANDSSAFFAPGWVHESGKKYANLNRGTVGDVSSKEWSWDVPIGITSISILCIGAGGSGTSSTYSQGGGGGGGGALVYNNNISVTPGETLTIGAGNPTATRVSGFSGASIVRGTYGGWSYVKRGSTTLIQAAGGDGGSIASNISADGGRHDDNITGSILGRGGMGGYIDAFGGGGGGAGGYNTYNSNAQGGNGDTGYNPDVSVNGGGGGATKGYLQYARQNNGGGTWPFGNNPLVNGAAIPQSNAGGNNYGAGNAEGIAGSCYNPYTGTGGISTEGSVSINYGGITSLYNTSQTVETTATVGTDMDWLGPIAQGWTIPVAFGGGGGGMPRGLAYGNNANTRGGIGMMGCVRIIWGTGRSFPGTNVRHQYNVDDESPVSFGVANQ